jgi:hypothetical protein
MVRVRALVQVVAEVAVAALPLTLIGHVPVGVPPSVILPDVVTVPVSVSPPYPPAPATDVTVPV